MGLTPYELFRHRTAELRNAASAEGLFDFARKELTAQGWLAFRASLQILGLPESPDEVRDSPVFQSAREAFLDLVFGLSEEVVTANVGELGHLGFTSTADVAVDLGLAGAIRVDGNAEFATVEISGGSLLVLGNISATGDCSAGQLGTPSGLRVGDQAGLVALPYQVGKIRAGGPVVPNGLVLTARSVYWDVRNTALQMFDFGNSPRETGGLFLDSFERLVWAKARTNAVAADTRVYLDAPEYDTGWMKFVAHISGDTGTNPPYEFTYPLGPIPGTILIGDQLGFVDLQVWTRRASQYGPATVQAQPNDTLYEGSGIGNVGAAVVLHPTKGVVLHVNAASLSGSASGILVLEFRIMARLRGF